MTALRTLHENLRNEFGSDTLILSFSSQRLTNLFRSQISRIEQLVALTDKVIPTSHANVSVNIRPLSGWTINDIDTELKFKVNGKLEFQFLTDNSPAGRLLLRSRTVTVSDLEFAIIGDQTSSSGLSIFPTRGQNARISSRTDGAAPPDSGNLGAISLSELDYSILEEAFLLVSAPNIAATISQLLDIPPFRKLLVAVDFKGSLLATTSLPDRITITGKPMYVSQGACAYGGEGKKYSLSTSPGREELREVCGNYLAELIGDIVVAYPKEVFQAVFDMKALARPTVREWGDRSDTVHYVQYDVSLALASATIKFDPNSLAISIDTVFEPSGSGHAGFCVLGCDATRTKLVSISIDPLAKIPCILTAEPCIDEKNVYLRVMWTFEPTVPIEFSLDGAPPGPLKALIEAVVSDSISVKLEKEIRDKACQNLEIPLIALDGLMNPFHGSDKQRINAVSRDLLDKSIMLNITYRAV